MICSLVISTFRQTDELIWIGTPKGEFSIRSTYHLEKTYFVQVAGESTTTDVHRIIVECGRPYGNWMSHVRWESFFERLLAIYCQPMRIHLEKSLFKICCDQFKDRRWRLLVIFYGVVHLQMICGGTVLRRFKIFPMEVKTLCWFLVCFWKD